MERDRLLAERAGGLCLALDPGVAERHLHSIGGDADSEGKCKNLRSWASSERKEELMKEAAKGWQVEPRRNESVNSNLPSAFVIHKTIR